MFFNWGVLLGVLFVVVRWFVMLGILLGGIGWL